MLCGTFWVSEGLGSSLPTFGNRYRGVDKYFVGGGLYGEVVAPTARSDVLGDAHRTEDEHVVMDIILTVV